MTTPTTDEVNWYTTGYQDGKTGKPNAYAPPVIVVGPTAPVRTVIQPTSNLPATLNALKAGSLVQLVKGGAYGCPSAIILPPQVSLDANQANITFTPPQGTTSLFSVSNPGCEVFNIALTPSPTNAADILFRVTAPNFSAHDCVIGDGLFSAVVTNVTGVNAIFNHLTVGKTIDYAMYTEANGSQWLNSTFGGSQNQATCRTSPAASGVTPSGLQVIDCDIAGGGADKGSMEWRQHLNGLMKGCTLRDYVRFGQKVATLLNQWGGVTVQSNHFMSPSDSTMPQLLVSSGMNMVVDSNTLDTLGMQVAVAAGAWSTIKSTGNTRTIADKTKAYRPLLAYTAVAVGTPSYPSMTETGSVIS